MSAEYSVEEVQAQAKKELRSGVHSKSWDMLNAYADILERIKADEGVVQWRCMDSAPRDGTVILLRWGEDAITPGWWCGDVALPPDHGPSDEYLWKFIDAKSSEFGQYFVNTAKDNESGPSHWAAYSEAKLFSPPAQAAQLWEMKQRACRAHALCNELRLAHPEIPELGDDGVLHDAIHDILRVDTPTAEPVAQGDAIYQRHLAVPGYWEDITREQWEKARRIDTRVLHTAQPRAVPTITARVVGMTPGMALIELKLPDYVPEWADVGHSVVLAAAPSPGESA